MAFYSQPEDDEEKKKSSAEPSIATAPGLQVLGASTEQPQQDENIYNTGASPAGGSPVGGGGAVGQRKSTGSKTNTGFTNIQQYLDANKGGAQKLGQQATEQLNQASQKVRDTTEASANQLLEQNQVSPGGSQKGTINTFDENDIPVQKEVNLLDYVSDPNFQGFATPEQEAEFRRMASGQAPELKNTDFQLPTEQLNEVSTFQNQLKTPEGQKQFIEAQPANQGRTAGTTALDQLLLGTSPDAQNILNRATTSAGELPGQVQDIKERALQQALDRASEVGKQDKQSVQDRITGPGGVFEQLQGEANTLSEARSKAASATQQQTLSKLGKLNELNNILPDLINEQRAKANALVKLGIDPMSAKGMFPVVLTTEQVEQAIKGAGAELSVDELQDLKMPGYVEKADELWGKVANGEITEQQKDIEMVSWMKSAYVGLVKQVLEHNAKGGTQISLQDFVSNKDVNKMFTPSNVLSPQQLDKANLLSDIVGVDNPFAGTANPALTKDLSDLNVNQLFEILER